MISRVFIATALCLGVIACGGSDDTADKAGAVSEVTDKTAVTLEEQAAPAGSAEPAEEIAAADQVASTNTGESVYNRACAGCHLTGAAGAPKVGDKSAWADRIAKGSDALVQSAIKGVPGTAMLARGTCNACTDDDIKVAVDYMISQSQ